MTSKRDDAQKDLLSLLEFFWSIKSQLSVMEWDKIDSIANSDYSLSEIDELKNLRGKYDAAYFKIREVEQGLIKLTDDVNAAMLAKALEEETAVRKTRAKPAQRKQRPTRWNKRMPVNQWWQRVRYG